MYKLQKAFNIAGNEVNVTVVEKLIDNAFIPFDSANTDYQQFKAGVLAGAELQDADGKVMTQEEADAFIATLP